MRKIMLTGLFALAACGQDAPAPAPAANEATPIDEPSPALDRLRAALAPILSR